MSLAVGDKAVITGETGDFVDWNGLEVEVLGIFEEIADAYVRPLSERPDGNGFQDFYWTIDTLVKS